MLSEGLLCPDIEIDIFEVALQFKIQEFKRYFHQMENLYIQNGVIETLLRYLIEPNAEIDNYCNEMAYLWKDILKLNPEIALENLIETETTFLQRLIINAVVQCYKQQHEREIAENPQGEPTRNFFTTLYNQVTETFSQLSFSSTQTATSSSSERSSLDKYRGIV